METQLQSLSKIFTERLFRIPDYQRGYAWTEKQVKDFWNDLIQLEHDSNHYVGVLTLENVPREKYTKWEDDFWIIDSKSYTPYFIVDGQQRLTTTIILIQAIIEQIHDDKKINYTSKSEIKKKFIYDSKDDGISKSFIFGYDKDNPSYEFLKTKIMNESSEDNFLEQETVYTYNLERAKQFFIDNLSKLDINEVERIYKKLTQNFLFNIYTISSDIDVFITFETMNNRGKPLSHLELLKNRLIYLSTLFNTPDYEKEKLRKNINECWKDIYHYLGKNKLNPLNDDVFLANHFKIYFEKEYRNDVNQAVTFKSGRSIGYDYARNNYQEYLLEKKFVNKNIDLSNSNDNGKVTMQNINDYVKSLKNSVKFWYYIFNSNDSSFNEEIKEYLEKLKRVNITNEAPLIMVYLQKDVSSNDILDFLKVLERFRFTRLLYTGCYSIRTEIRYFDTFTLAERLFKNEITIADVIKRLNDSTNKLLNDVDLNKELRERFKKDGFYSWAGIKYFLYEYEIYLKTQSKTDRYKIIWEDYNRRDYETIEHVYPQRPRNDYWNTRFGQYSPKEKNALRNSLGNLAPLSRPKNASLNNKPFPDKVGNSSTTVGYKYGSYSEIELTNYKEWTPKQILDRGIKLVKFLEKRWGYKVGSGTNAERADFLGLKFLL